MQKSRVNALCCLQSYGASAQEAEAGLASAAVGQSAGKTKTDSIGWGSF